MLSCHKEVIVLIDKQITLKASVYHYQHDQLVVPTEYQPPNDSIRITTKPKKLSSMLLSFTTAQEVSINYSIKRVTFS